MEKKERKKLVIKETKNIQMEELNRLMFLAKEGYIISGMRCGSECEIYLERDEKK